MSGLGGSGSKRVVLAAVAGAHGVRGEVRLKLWAESLDSLKGKAVEIGDRPFLIEAIRPASGGAVARLVGVTTREAAEALRGQELGLDRADLPPLDEGEYYHADLLGLPVVDGDGTELGIVRAVENYGAGDLIEVERPDGTRTLVPFRDGIAELVDGRIRVDAAFLA